MLTGLVAKNFHSNPGKLLLMLVASLLLWLEEGCCHQNAHVLTGREFLSQKTGVLIPKGISVCPTGVRDNELCQPAGGGPAWDHNWNVPEHKMPADVVATFKEDSFVLLKEVAKQYLGTPYTFTKVGGGELAPACKQQNSDAEFKPEIQSDYLVDVSALLKDKSVTETTTSFRLSLEGKWLSAKASLSTSAIFKKNLETYIEKKITAKFLWFVIRYPGGLDGLITTENPVYKECVTQVRKFIARWENIKPQASLITGVAGYIVLSNKLDASINDVTDLISETMGTLGGDFNYQQMLSISAEIQKTWKSNVAKVAQILLAREALSVIVYPLWIQFGEWNTDVEKVKQNIENQKNRSRLDIENTFLAK